VQSGHSLIVSLSSQSLVLASSSFTVAWHSAVNVLKTTKHFIAKIETNNYVHSEIIVASAIPLAYKSECPCFNFSTCS